MTTKFISLHNFFRFLYIAALFPLASLAARPKTTPARLEKRPLIYLRADGIYSMPANKIMSKGRKFKKAFGGNIGIGYVFGKKFRSDITATYRGDYKDSYFYPPNYKTWQKVNSLAFMLNGYFTPPLSVLSIKPYLSAGAGFASNKAGNIYTSDTSIAYGACQRAFAWQVGAGLTRQIQRNCHIEVAYKYINLGKITTSGAMTTAGRPGLSIDPAKGIMKANEVSVGIVWFLT